MKTKTAFYKPLLILLTFILSWPTFAQHHAKIKALKVSYITTALDLTPKEAQQFWPIYNMYDDEIKAMRRAENKLFKPVKEAGGIDKITDKNAQSIIKNVQELEIKLAAKKNKMRNELLKVISAKKVLKLHQAEHNFKRKMLREYGKRKRGR
ncbi:MAG TPA: hypothetical protein VJ970_02515 [Flavobacteriaceae bacterium]|nr:hypothetical protein [Flavobacteriaceae bacterium]